MNLLKRISFYTATFSVAIFGSLATLQAADKITVKDAVELAKKTGKPILVVEGSKT